MEVVTGLVGLVVGALLVLLLRRRPREEAAVRPPRDPPPDAAAVVAALPAAVAVLDRSDEVQLANRRAVEIGVVRDQRVPDDALRGLAREARRTGRPQSAELALPATGLGRGPQAVRVRLAPVEGSGHVAVLVEDVTEARRVEAVRHDFVANVSHELKTPVGALSLLAEALQDAADDPA
ncbi:MAG: two-component sensor histidine kinase, partial [Actinomycetota bacterium]|nr:two-component sensor histidine kinase [Actinomycetota bacterium]